jgi:serine protease Do
MPLPPPPPKKEPKPKKKKGAAFVAMIVALTIVVGIGAGAGTTLLTTGMLSTANSAAKEPGSVPQIPINPPPEVNLTGDTLEPGGDVLMTPEELFEAVQDGVVGIEISFRSGFGATQTQLVGSGFVFTTDGYVLTNEHVIENATSVVVIVNDYEDRSIEHRYEAEVVGSDRATDLAVLKISRDEEFKALPIGKSSTLKVGTFVCAIGFPFGMKKSLTFGVVSGLNREFADGGYELSSIQTDAAVNSGNSGGPLLDMYGNVVGIVNKKLVWQNLIENMGFAITIDEAKTIINDLLMYGSVASRPKLGITPVVLNEYTAAFYGLTVTRGILVQSIFPNAPAAKSDLSPGDVIIEIDGVEIASVEDVQTQIKGKQPGDEVELTVIRRDEAGANRRFYIKIELASSADLD